jgi:hypothetical protein
MGDNVLNPRLTECVKGQHIDAACAQHRPKRQFDRAGIGGRHDGDSIFSRNLKNFAREVDDMPELFPAGSAAVRTPEQSVF